MCFVHNKQDQIIKFIKSFNYNNYYCEIYHNLNQHEAGLGYIILPQGHFLYGKNKEDININIHGGFTFSQEINNKYVIGFDTNHGFDYDFIDEFRNRPKMINNKTDDFIEKELKQAIDQIILLEKSQNV